MLLDIETCIKLIVVIAIKVVENPLHGVMTADELAAAAVRQVDIEMKDKVIVETILPRSPVTPEILKAVS